MATIRTFVAIELPGSVKARAKLIVNELKQAGAKVTWVKPEQLHLTLKFLGDVPESDIPAVCRVVQEAVRDFEPFELVFRGCGAFPTTAKPRTIWIGVEQGEEELRAVQEAIDIGLKKLRFPREVRRFQAHLTLGRVRESGPAATELGEMIERMGEFDGDLTAVDEVVTFASFPDKKLGTMHDALGYAELRGKRTAKATAAAGPGKKDEEEDDEEELEEEGDFDWGDEDDDEDDWDEADQR
jgi:2'-5' RNA ligase